MHVDGNECLKLGPLHLGQVACGLVDECVEELEEGVVCLLHHLAVVTGILQGVSGVAGPDQLDAEQAHLEGRWDCM